MTGSSARIAWFEELGTQTERNRPAPDVALPAPAGVTAMELRIEGLSPGRRTVRHRRVDAGHSNVASAWDGGDWPGSAAWQRLRAADHLDELEPEREVEVGPDGQLTLEFDLPMPAISFVEIVPD